MTNRLFVYGTLMRRSTAHRLLRGARYLSNASLRGVLYDLGTYPGLVKKKRSSGRSVFGELYELPEETSDRMLRDLDRYEGREYVRRRVFVRMPNGRRRAAWTYVLRGAPPRSARELPSGRYAEKRTVS